MQNKELGFWRIEGPHYSQNGVPVMRRWRVEFTPTGRNYYGTGVAWGPTEEEAKRRAKIRAKLRNYTRTLR